MLKFCYFLGLRTKSVLFKENEYRFCHQYRFKSLDFALVSGKNPTIPNPYDIYYISVHPEGLIPQLLKKSFINQNYTKLKKVT